MTGAGATVCSPNQVMVARLQARGFAANVPLLLRARGDLDRDTLREALQMVVDRHAILRATFEFDGDLLMQKPDRPCAVVMKWEDLADLPDPLTEAQAAIRRTCREVFDSNEAIRLRPFVYRLGVQDHLIAVVFDHLAADGMSLATVIAEWRAFYQAIEAGTPPTVSGLAQQYSAFATWQRDWLHSIHAERHRVWWTNQLRDLPGSAVMGVRSGGPFVARAIAFDLGATVSRQISTLCVRHRVTPFMALLAAYLPLVGSLVSERTVLIATVRANRSREDFRGTVGHFANLTPLRLMLDPNSSADQLIEDVASVCRSSYAHDELPFLELAAIASHVGLPASALAEFSINFVPFPTEPVAWSSGLYLSQLWGFLDQEPLATGRLALFVRQEGDRLGGALIYDPRTIGSDWAEAFPGRLAALTAMLSRSPAPSVGDLLSIGV